MVNETEGTSLLQVQGCGLLGSMELHVSFLGRSQQARLGVQGLGCWVYFESPKPIMRFRAYLESLDNYNHGLLEPKTIGNWGKVDYNYG